jgi:hypothetical protein
MARQCGLGPLVSSRSGPRDSLGPRRSNSAAAGRRLLWRRALRLYDPSFAQGKAESSRRTDGPEDAWRLDFHRHWLSAWR